MKYAILLTGLQRNHKPFINNQKECLINDNNCDVFIYTSNDSFNRYVDKTEIKYVENKKYNNEEDYFLTAYGEKLKDIYIDYDENRYDAFRSKYFSDCRNDFNINLIKAYFKVFSAIDIMEQYETENNIKYDGVFRARLDSFFLRKIDLTKYDLNDTYCTIAHDTYHKDDAGIFMDRKKLQYLKSFVFELIEKRNQEINIKVEEELFSYIKRHSTIKYIPNFINRVGCPPTLKYNEVPYLSKIDFDELSSLEYDIHWDKSSGMFNRKIKKINLLSRINYKMKNMMRKIL